MKKTVVFQAIPFSSLNVKTVRFCSSNVKTVQSQTIHFSKSTQFSSIWLIDRTLSGVTTPGQSEPGGNGNEGVLHILQSSYINEASSSDCFVSYPEHSLGESYPFGEM